MRVITSLRWAICWVLLVIALPFAITLFASLLVVWSISTLGSYIIPDTPILRPSRVIVTEALAPI